MLIQLTLLSACSCRLLHAARQPQAQSKTTKMPTLHQYDYIFAIGLLFAALDAYNIGANDVANSFATSAPPVL